ncbi:MAG: glycosyltransferase family 4 protein [Chloroflexi bacterium]|nr:glycosyltransferase family 4 protein [Chloroflexota bacterium]
MRIAYVCADLGIPVLGNKGASVHVREFTGALAALGHTVHIFAATGAAKGATLEAGATSNTTTAALTVVAPSQETRAVARQVSTSLLRLGWQRNPAHLTSELEHVLADTPFVAAALPLLREFAPDLLIARHAIFSVAGRDLARALSCPYVLEVNAPLMEERRRYWGLTLERVAEASERTALAEVDLVVAVSEGVRNYLVRCGATPDRIAVLPNGVDLARFHPGVDGTEVRRHYGLEDRIVIGFAGSLKPWHGVELLMRAFVSVRTLLRQRGRNGDPEVPVLHLLIIGDGPLYAQLIQLSHDLGLDGDATFTGALPHHQVPAHLAAVDVAVAPYVSSDGFYFSPLKVMEYMAMGRAIVAPTLGQIPSLLQGSGGACGVLYQPDYLQDLATALLRLACDSALRQTLGARAAAQARRHYSWQMIAQQIITRAVPGNSKAEPVPVSKGAPV